MDGEYVNTNGHDAYLPNPKFGDGDDEPQLIRVRTGDSVKLSDRLAEIAHGTPRFVNVDSPQGKAFMDKAARENAKLLAAAGTPGEAAYPVTNEDELAEPSGLHITGDDAGLPVASDDEPGPHRDGSGEDDDQEGVAAVIKGDVTRGDVPLGREDDGARILEESRKDIAAQVAGPVIEDYEAMTLADLKKAAKRRGIEVTNSEGKKKLVKDDYVRALSVGTA